MHDTHSLRYFLTAYEVGSFTGAAAALGVKQPSVSTAISKLEERYCGRLFERSRQGLRPTPKGRDLYQQLAPLLAQLDQIEGRMQQRAPKVLRIYCQPDILLAPYTAALQALQRARWDLSLLFSDTAEQSDVAFVSKECLPQGFQFHPVLQEPYGLAVPHHHPFAMQGEISCDALAQEALIGRPYCPRADRVWHEIASQLGPDQFVPVANAVHDHQVLDLVRAGVGVALVPRGHIDGVTGIKFITLKGQVVLRQIGVAVRKTAHAHGLAEALIAALPQNLETL